MTVRNFGLFILFSFITAIAYAGPQIISYEGYIENSSGPVNPLPAAPTVSINIRYEIRTPSNCVLYSETENVVPKDGVFSSKIGDGPAASGETFTNAFSNSGGPYNGTSSCGYTPGPSDTRKLAVFIDDGGFTQVAEMDLSSAPFAMNSDKLNGLSSGDFVRTNTDVTQAKMDSLLAPSVYNNLLNLNSSSTGAFEIPSGTSAQRPSGVPGMIRYNGDSSLVEFYNGSGWIQMGAASGTVTSVTSGNSYLSVANGTSTPSLTLNVGTTANTVAAGDDSRIVNAIQNAGFTPSIRTGAEGSQGAAGTNGRVFIASDSLKIYRDNGSTWNLLASRNAADLIGTITPDKGGTGQTTYTDGQLLIGNTAGNTLTKTTLTAGTGISISNGPGSITISSTAGSGSVTSVGINLGAQEQSVFNASAPITTSGNIDLSFDLQSANLIFAGPPSTAGGSTKPSFRALVADDIPGIDGVKITSGTIPGARMPAFAGGDVISTGGTNLSVEAIRGTSIASANPTSTGQVLRYNLGTARYEPQFVFADDIRSSVGPSYNPIFPAAACSLNQTLRWDSATQTFFCSNVDTLDAAKITTGLIGSARLGNGTASSSTFLRGDGQWIAPPGLDNLGNHTATQNIVLGTNWISGDGTSEGISIDAAGSVGIGTPTPSAKFHVFSGDANLDIGFSYKIGDEMVLNRTVAQVTVGSNLVTPLSFWAGGEKMRLKTTGELGIGTTNPLSPLDVRYDGSTTAPAISVGSANTAGLGLFAPTANTLGFVAMGGTRMTIDSAEVRVTHPLRVLNNDITIASGANSVTLRAPATGGAQTIVFPSTAPTTGQVLTSIGGNNTQWMNIPTPTPEIPHTEIYTANNGGSPNYSLNNSTPLFTSGKKTVFLDVGSNTFPWIQLTCVNMGITPNDGEILTIIYQRDGNANANAAFQILHGGSCSGMNKPIFVNSYTTANAIARQVNGIARKAYKFMFIGTGWLLINEN